MTGRSVSSFARRPGSQGATQHFPWLGRTVLVLVLAVIGVGAVVLLYDRGWLPVAGIFVAMIVGPVVIYLRRLWLARRLHRLRHELDEQLAALVSPTPPPGGPDPTGRLADAARRHLAAGDDDAAAHRVDELRAVGGAAASSGSPLARHAAEVAATAEKLRRTRRTVDGQLRRN